MQPEFQNSEQPQPEVPAPQASFKPEFQTVETPLGQPVQPSYETQIPPQQPQFQPQRPVGPQGDDPGKGLAVAGIVSAFFFTLLGLILSIIAKKKSKAAGFNNSLATIGIILNAVFLVIGLLVAGIWLFIALTAYHGLQDRAVLASSQAYALNVVKEAEIYNADNGTYPHTISELKSASGFSADTKAKLLFASSPITSKPSTQITLEFYTCGKYDDATSGYGNKVGYWNDNISDVSYLYSGYADESSDCTLVIN